MSKFYDIIDTVPAEDRAMVALDAHRYLNSVPGQRPSDAARSSVEAYNRDPEAFRRHFKQVRGQA